MLRRSRRPALSALVAFLALVSLAACGGSSGGDDSSASTPPSAAASGDGVTGSIVVLAASSLTESFTTLGKTFESEHPGSKVTISFAASSELASQIEGGAPADVFASASPATMQQVSDAGALAGDAVVFVRNSLEIAVPAGNPAKVTGLADFAKKPLTIALCAPEVPCGAAAAKVFEVATITPAPDTLEADVKATLAKVTLGEVDAALVYKTDVQSAGDKVEGIDFPEAAQAVNDYPMAVLSDSRDAATAQAFVDLVRSAQGASVLTAAGFDVP
jgi:molybdate transport system substrate-binding protein